MRTLLGIVLLLTVGPADCRTAGFSVVIDTDGSVFAYELRTTDSNELLFWAPSSYQPEAMRSRDAMSALRVQGVA